ncbi:MAG: NfeD family protein [Candidatus Sumerlaeia bacterium]|nr:NfeD family protein [Candidatus Sumerlaeia bacterium]
MNWLIYAVIGASGMLFLLLSLMLGGDAGHGDAGDVGGLHTDGVSVAGGGVGHDVGDLGSWFSLKVLSGFAVGFGSGGFIASVLDAGTIGSLASASVCGAAIAAAARAIIGMFHKNESTSHTTEQALLGREGVVSQTILSGRTGEVEVDGVYRAARSTGETELKVGAAVRVVALGGTLTVEPAGKG